MMVSFSWCTLVRRKWIIWLQLRVASALLVRHMAGWCSHQVRRQLFIIIITMLDINRQVCKMVCLLVGKQNCVAYHAWFTGVAQQVHMICNHQPQSTLDHNIGAHLAWGGEKSHFPSKKKLAFSTMNALIGRWHLAPIHQLSKDCAFIVMGWGDCLG